MKYTELLKTVKTAQESTKVDGIQSYFYRSNGKLELTYPAVTLPDNDITFNQLCKLSDMGLVEFDGADDIVLINTI